MKSKITKIALFTCLVGTMAGFAQNQDGLSDSVKRRGASTLIKRKNVINVNLSSMLISHYGISYERALTDKISVRLYGDVASANYVIQDYDIKMAGFGIVPEFRYYVSKSGAPYNYFIGLYGVIRKYTIDGSFIDDGKKYTGNGDLSYYGFGFVNGPQFIIGNRIVLAIPFGISFGGGNTSGNFSYVDATNPTLNESKSTRIPFIGGSAVMPRFGIELGIAF
ncbi:MAG: DUF3575 domain-containing protein [Cytophagales bacterium]